MPRLFLLVPLLIAISTAAQVPVFCQDSVLRRCPTLARLIETGDINHFGSPDFTDPEAARNLARNAAKVVRELDALDTVPEGYVGLRRQAAFVAEFLSGDLYTLSTSNVKSVVKLREWVKIPPPEGLVYVKKYPSRDAMPPEVAEAFSKLTTSGSQVRGVTMQGRYIALLESDYHDELVDVLAHELVHAYITMACPSELPLWFQEAAAVYFSTDREVKAYGKTGDPKMMQVTIPEDYKRKLYSFRYLEKKVGRKKLYAFVKEAVETGNVDPRSVLGLSATQEIKRRPLWPVLAGVGLIAVIFIALMVRSHLRENWAD